MFPGGEGNPDITEVPRVELGNCHVHPSALRVLQKYRFGSQNAGAAVPRATQGSVGSREQSPVTKASQTVAALHFGY